MLSRSYEKALLFCCLRFPSLSRNIKKVLHTLPTKKGYCNHLTKPYFANFPEKKQDIIFSLAPQQKIKKAPSETDPLNPSFLIQIQNLHRNYLFPYYIYINMSRRKIVSLVLINKLVGARFWVLEEYMRWQTTTHDNLTYNRGHTWSYFNSIGDAPREQVAAKPKPTTSSGATVAREHADLIAAQTASHISVDDCCHKTSKVWDP